MGVLSLLVLSFALGSIVMADEAVAHTGTTQCGDDTQIDQGQVKAGWRTDSDHTHVCAGVGAVETPETDLLP